MQPGSSATNAVVEGMMIVYNSWDYILFDTGATYSFISFAFASSLGLHVKGVDGALCVASPLGGEMVVGHVCRSCVVRVDGHELTADSVVLDMVGYDIILGMDWLAAHHALVDCYKKRVIIHSIDGTVLQLCGSVGPTLAPLGARRIACLGALSDFLEEVREVPGLSQILVVCEFVDVFSDGGAGLPPVREVEFSIKLLFGMEPISFGTYRMAPMELRELKK